MIYIHHIATAPLNSYVDCICYRNDPMPYPREKILPLPSVDLKINLGGAWNTYKADQHSPSYIGTESWCIGLWDAYHIVDWPPDLQVFIVYFKPCGIYPFLQLPLSELHNQVVSLDTIWGQFASEIRERLYAAPTINAGLALLEQLLLARLCEAPHGLTMVQYALSEIARHHGALSIRTLSDDIGVSHKHLITQFKRMVGGTPKELARLYRFQHALQCIDLDTSIDWTRIAHQSDYYDQSHFNKDFEAFTGTTPTEYLRLRRQVQAVNPDHAQYLRQMPTG